jgi:hypothetical protein
MNCLQVRWPPAYIHDYINLWQSSNVATMNSEDDVDLSPCRGANLYPSVLSAPLSLHDWQGKLRSNGATDDAAQDYIELENAFGLNKEPAYWNNTSTRYEDTSVATVLSSYSVVQGVYPQPPPVSGYNGGTQCKSIGHSLDPDFNLDYSEIQSRDISDQLTLPESPPPSFSLSESQTSSSFVSFPMTPPSMGNSRRTSVLGISQQKIGVLENAFACALEEEGVLSTEVTEFLARFLRLDNSKFRKWLGSRPCKDAPPLNRSKRAKISTNGPVAVWKRKIIHQGLEVEPHPKSTQVNLLAIGLRISVDQFWNSTKESVNLGRDPNRREKMPQQTPTPVVSKEQPSAPSLVSPTISTVRISHANTDASSTGIPPAMVSKIKSPTIKVSSSDSPPWVPLVNGVQPRGGIGVGVYTNQHPQTVVGTLESLPGRDQPVESRLEHDSTPAASIANDSECESSVDDDDGSTEISLEEEIATILGPDYAHLAQCVINKIASNNPWEQWQSEDGFRQGANGVDNTPASSFSQTSGNAPSSNTSFSETSGGKRKSPGGGGGGGEDDQANDGDGDKGRPPKRLRRPPSTPKPEPPRYDCPISKRAIGTGGDPQSSKSRGCAPEGLEFRHVWYAYSNSIL